MLYATTRSGLETYTAGRVLKDWKAPDGGLYVPITLPQLLPWELRKYADQSAADVVADILNRFFGGKLSGREIEFAVGRDFFSTKEMPYKLTVAELWRNPDGSVDRLVRQLAQVASGSRFPFEPGEWTHIAVRIALMTAVLAEMLGKGKFSVGTGVDVGVAAGDTPMLMAAWYGRRMGLPIREIVVGCNTNGIFWDLLNRGQIRCGSLPARTCTPLYDAHCFDTMERLICAACGRVEANRFAAAAQKRSGYLITTDQRRHLQSGIFVSVMGNRRVERTIPNVYGSFSYIFSPYSALVYCAATDYRSETGAHNPMLMFCSGSPANSAGTVTAAMGITEEELRRRLSEK